MIIKINILLWLFTINCVFSQNKLIYPVIEKPLDYSNERIHLSLDYMEKRHGLKQTTPIIQPKIIVLHYTAGGTITSNYAYFNKSTIENKRGYNKNQSLLNVSAHYLVDRDGTIYHLMADTLFARHTIGLNYCAIGIENIGSKNKPLTKNQVLANEQLIRKLVKDHPIQYVIGHSEYTSFRNSTLWKETNKKYFTNKEDPGKEFMQQIRQKISDLNLKYIP